MLDVLEIPANATDCIHVFSAASLIRARRIPLTAQSPLAPVQARGAKQKA